MAVYLIVHNTYKYINYFRAVTVIGLQLAKCFEISAQHESKMCVLAETVICYSGGSWKCLV